MMNPGFDSAMTEPSYQCMDLSREYCSTVTVASAVPSSVLTTVALPWMDCSVQISVSTGLVNAAGSTRESAPRTRSTGSEHVTLCIPTRNTISFRETHLVSAPSTIRYVPMASSTAALSLRASSTGTPEGGRGLARARLPEGLEGITRLHALVAEHAPGVVGGVGAGAGSQSGRGRDRD